MTPVYGSEHAVAARRPARLAEGREPAAHRARSRCAAPSTSSRTLGDAERAAGVIAASAGNHGQAVAWAARELGITATVFMPQDAPMAKVEATRNYGAETVLAGAGFDEALAEALARAERDRRDVRARLRGRGGDRGPGHDRARARRRAARRRDVRRSRSAAAASRPGSRSRCARCGPDVRIVGVQAGKTRPRHDRRRHRRQASRAS